LILFPDDDDDDDDDDNPLKIETYRSVKSDTVISGDSIVRFVGVIVVNWLSTKQGMNYIKSKIEPLDHSFLLT
jgi:hypothetical protein